MISLKQHNNIVEKLMNQIDTKQKQIKQIVKQANKMPQQTPQLESTKNQQNLNKKINQLNKQHKERINVLNQQLRSRSNEIKDLKERLQIQKNIEAKQKAHTSEMFRKNFDRKPSTTHDYKVAALISHYEEQIASKSNFIKKLQQQLSNAQQKEPQQADIDPNIQTFMPSTKDHSIQLSKHQKQISKIQSQVIKYKRMYQEKQKENKNLNKKYEELTKEYYKHLNQYNSLPSKKQPNFIKEPSFNKNQRKNHLIGNILADVFMDQSQESPETFDLQTSFQNNLSKLQNKSAVQNKSQEKLLINKIKSMLNLDEQDDPIEQLLKIQSKLSMLTHYQNIVRQASNIVQLMGFGKVPVSEIALKLTNSMQRIQMSLQGLDLLDEICIQAGAKRNKIIERIRDLKSTQCQYIQNMKNIKFVKELPKTNKIVQFIQYFQLDQQQIQLPQQLKKIYDQLKFVNRFMKQSNTILEKQSSSIQITLQNILRVLEKYRSSNLWEKQFNNKNVK